MDSSQDCCYTQAGQGQDSGEVVTSALPQALPYVWTSHAIERCAYIAQQLQIQAKFCKNCGYTSTRRVFCHLQGLSHGTDLYFFIPEKQHVCYLELGLHDGSHSLALGSSTRLGLLNNLSHSGSFARSTSGSRSLKEQLHAIVSKRVLSSGVQLQSATRMRFEFRQNELEYSIFSCRGRRSSSPALIISTSRVINIPLPSILSITSLNPCGFGADVSNLVRNSPCNHVKVSRSPFVPYHCSLARLEDWEIGKYSGTTHTFVLFLILHGLLVYYTVMYLHTCANKPTLVKLPTDLT
ncbi:hypothetical protein GGU11DRAFT_21729 [Lentinula aff. detonsa]|nr:hypothetical protein GGU11DRAFT_21729 [Lentinula aff. detonsa]